MYFIIKYSIFICTFNFLPRVSLQLFAVLHIYEHLYSSGSANSARYRMVLNLIHSSIRCFLTTTPPNHLLMPFHFFHHFVFMNMQKQHFFNADLQPLIWSGSKLHFVLAARISLKEVQDQFIWHSS